MMGSLVGKRVKGYQFLTRVRLGETSEVYRALQASLDREVAIKVIRPPLANQPAFIRNFERYAQQIARLEHLHLLPLLEFWREPDGTYLVSRWMPAGSLSQALTSGQWDLPGCLRLVDHVTAALAAVHSHGMVHGNLTSANILLDEEGHAYVSDLALVVDSAAAEHTQPEHDLLALGQVVKELLTGHRAGPHAAGSFKGISSKIQDFLKQANHPKPTKGFADAHAFARAFRKAAGIDSIEESTIAAEQLTRREHEILAQVVSGASNKEIARALTIELGTVKWHITQLYRKLGVRRRMEAIVRARHLGLIEFKQHVEQDQPIIHTKPVLIKNPYKGLRPFTTADNRDFFGRETVVDQLLNRLCDGGPRGRLLAVLGPSGAGKSSLISAGLVPAILNAERAKTENWFVVTMTPGVDPIGELSAALNRIATIATDDLRADLTENALSLAEIKSRLLPRKTSELVLIIDQFEELFMPAAGQQPPDLFLDLLSDAVQHPDSQVKIVIAMRADYFDRPLAHRRFGEQLQEGMVTLLPLGEEELQSAILSPLHAHEVSFEVGLVEQIIEEVLNRPGGLPLLQYALTELFEQRVGDQITKKAYSEMGGVGGALTATAEDIYRDLSEQGKETTRQLFLNLVHGNVVTDGYERSWSTRRRALRMDLLALAEEDEQIDELIDTFSAYRLLTLDHDQASRQPTVELAHESLTTEWPRLRAWSEESRQDLLQLKRLRSLANDWQSAHQASDYLLLGARLDQVIAWRTDSNLSLPATEQAFLDESLQYRAARRKADAKRKQRELETAQRLALTESLRAEEHREANHRLKRFSLGLILLLVAALGIALLAWSERNRAELQSRIAQARGLASEAIAQINGDPERSIFLAQQAVRLTYETDGYALPEAEAALHQSIQASRVMLSFPQSGGVSVSPDGSLLAIGDSRGLITLWDIQQAAVIGALNGHEQSVISIAFSDDGSRLASASSDQAVIVWEVGTGQEVMKIDGGGGEHVPAGLSAVDLSSDGLLLLATGQRLEAGLWDVDTATRLVAWEGIYGPTGAISPDGETIALMTAAWDLGLSDKRSREWQAQELITLKWSDRAYDYADPFLEFLSPSSSVIEAYQEYGSVSFSPDGTTMVTSVVSSLAVMRDAQTGTPLFTLDGHTNIITHTAFGPLGKQVATASADGTARVWDARTGELLLVLEGHQDDVMQVAFLPDGDRLITSSLDGSTKIWDITTGGGEYHGSYFQELGISFAFSPLADEMAVIYEDGTFQVIDIESGMPRIELGKVQVFSSLPGSQAIPLFNPAGNKLLISDRSRGLYLFSTESGEQIQAYQGDSLITALAFSPEGNLIASGSQAGVVSLLDADTGELLLAMSVGQGFVNGLVFDATGELLYIARAEGDVLAVELEALVASATAEHIRPIAQTAIVNVLDAHTDVVVHIELSSDGSRLLTASWDGTVKIWDSTSGELLLTLEGHTGRIWYATHLPDQERIATAGADGAILVWDAHSGELLYVLDNQSTGVTKLESSPSGAYLASVNEARELFIFVMQIDELLSLANERISIEPSE